MVEVKFSQVDTSVFDGQRMNIYRTKYTLED